MVYSRQVIIGIKTSFVGLHYWKDAPDSEAFLRNPHRHIFNVMVEMKLQSNASLDRQIEYFAVQQQLDAYISILWGRWSKAARPDSCEMIATAIADYILEHYSLAGVAVTVQEDDENFSRIELTEVRE